MTVRSEAARIATSSPAAAEARVTDPVRPRTAMSRPAASAPVVAEPPSTRMSLPAVAEAMVTEPAGVCTRTSPVAFDGP